MSTKAAIDLIKAREGCKLTAYQDGGGVWTIGYGHTGPEVKAGLTWTQEEAERGLAFDLGHAAAVVTKSVHVAVGDLAIGALISLTFNIGTEAFTKSTLLTLVNGGKHLAAAKEFLRWDHD